MLSKRAWLWLLLPIVLWTASPAVAQVDGADEDNQYKPATNRALVFTLDGFSLNGVNGGVGARFWVSRNVVLRSTLDFNLQSIENLTGDTAETGRSAVSVGTSLLVEWHSTFRRKVSPYMATGFGVGVGAYSETTDFSVENPLREVRNKGSFVDFTVDAGFGVAYRVNRWLELSGEHLFAVAFRRGDNEEKVIPREGSQVVVKSESTAFNVGLGTSRLLVSVYF